jgi:ureidoglycolate dehydrogenase (NAD+)
VIVDLPAAVVIDADRAAGPVAMLMATDHAVAKARLAGIGLAQVRRTAHRADRLLRAPRRRTGMAAIVMSSSTPNMAYHGARRAGVANSPLAIAVPSSGRPPLVLDMASSVAAAGKLKQAEDTGSPIPEGWALTKNGTPATDPAEADVLLPLGGAKGSGLALMIECLTGMMVGNPLLEAILSGREARVTGKCPVIAFNIAAFTDAGDFTQSSRLWPQPQSAAQGKRCRKSDARRARCGGRAERRRNGIPLARGTWNKLERLAKDKGLCYPRR